MLDAAHVLPILFSFTTPAKYCFRAVASFIRQVTGLPPVVPSDSVANIPINLSPPGTPGLNPPADDRLLSTSDVRLSRPSSNLQSRSSPASRDASPRRRGGSLFTSKKPVDDGATTPPRMSLRRALSSQVSRAGILFRGSGSSAQSPMSSPPRSHTHSPDPAKDAPPAREDSGDIAGPRFYGSGMIHRDDDVRRAGEPLVYQNGIVSTIEFLPCAYLAETLVSTPEL